MRPAYITHTRSATSATTPMSCVIRTTAEPKSLRSLRISAEDLRLDRDVERGRRLVRDQQVGLHESAIAIIARWRMPPENWCG